MTTSPTRPRSAANRRSRLFGTTRFADRGDRRARPRRRARRPLGLVLVDAGRQRPGRDLHLLELLQPRHRARRLHRGGRQLPDPGRRRTTTRPRPKGFPDCAWANSEVRFDRHRRHHLPDRRRQHRRHRRQVQPAAARAPGQRRLRQRAGAASGPQSQFPDRDVAGDHGHGDQAGRRAGPRRRSRRPVGLVLVDSRPAAAASSYRPAATKAPRTPTPLLAVYTGSAVNALTPVASNDDGSDSRTAARPTAKSSFIVVRRHHLPDRRRLEERRATAASTCSCEGAPANDDFAERAGSRSRAAELRHRLDQVRHQAGRRAEPRRRTGGPPRLVLRGRRPISGPVVVTACPYTERIVARARRLHRLRRQRPDPGRGDDDPRRGLRRDRERGRVRRRRRHHLPDRRRRRSAAASASSRSKSRAARPTTTSRRRKSSVPTPMTAGGNNRLATKQAGEPNHAGDAGGHSLWFSWTPSSSGPVDITACGYTREVDTLLAVYTGSAVNALTPVASNDDASRAAGERTLRIQPRQQRGRVRRRRRHHLPDRRRRQGRQRRPLRPRLRTGAGQRRLRRPASRSAPACPPTAAP